MKQFLVTIDSDDPKYDDCGLVSLALVAVIRDDVVVSPTNLSMRCRTCGWPVDTSVKPVFPDKFKYNEDDCPGHVAWVKDHRRCGRCGVHIESLRPPEDELPYKNPGLDGF